MWSGWQSWLDKQRQRCNNRMPWSSSAVQPKKAASAELSLAGQTYSMPEKRHQSLPRRLLGRRLKLERDESEELEQIYLKKLLKEHGLYTKHQTIQQRRRLRHLLELEQRATNDDASAVQANTNCPTCLIELHSSPIIADPNPEPLRRGFSLSALATATDGKTCAQKVTASLPTLDTKLKDNLEKLEDTVESESLKTIPENRETRPMSAIA